MRNWIPSDSDSSSRGLLFARGLIPWIGNETKGYIERRLQIAGTNPEANTLFSRADHYAVYRHSRGFPRLINTICENALITAYARQMQR
jgi:general secretion pathway protein A